MLPIIADTFAVLQFVGDSYALFQLSHTVLGVL